MKTAEFFTPCADCIFHVGGECAEGRGKTDSKDGCIEVYYYDAPLSELEGKPHLPKLFLKNSPDVSLCLQYCREKKKHVLFRDLCVELSEKLQEMQPDARTLAPEILAAAGYKEYHENEAVSNFEKVIDDVCVYVDFRTRINKIDIKSELLCEDGGNKINMRVDTITVGEFNNALALVGLPQFKI